MSWWMVAAAANAVVAVTYLAIAGLIVTPLLADGRPWRNPLGLATAAIFVTCAVHHGLHPLHMLLPAVGWEEHTGLPMRAAFDDWHSAVWDIPTALVGLGYWSLRSRFPALVRGGAIFEDLRERERQALELHDNVVQSLTVAQLSLDVGRPQDARRAVDDALAAAQAMMTDLLGPGHVAQPGQLRRDAPARHEGR